MVARVDGIKELRSDRAIIAGAYFDEWSYRTGFDFILPLLGYAQDSATKSRFERLVEQFKVFHCDFIVFNFFEISFECRPFWLVASFLNLSDSQQTTLIDLTTKSEKNILLLDKCPETVANRLAVGVRCAYGTKNIYEYITVYVQSQFCLVARSERLFQLNFIEALASNCIPVIYADNSVLPFDEVFHKLAFQHQYSKCGY